MASELGGFDWAALLDVQGLFGGRDVWVTTDGTAYCRTVGPPAAGQARLPETRVRFALNEADRDALARVLAEGDLAEIHTNQRYGVPDEARAILCVQRAGQRTAVGKWAGDPHAEFDAIYRLFVRIAGRAAEQNPQDADEWEATRRAAGLPPRRDVLDLDTLEDQLSAE